MALEKHVHVDPQVVQRDFNRKPFAFKHDLCGHPQLRLEALFDLATRLPPSEVLHWSGKIAVGDNIDTASKTHATGRTLRETIDHIQDANSYILVRNAQLDPAFKRLFDEIADSIGETTELLEPGMCERIAYMFIASPGSVTPYHNDRDINFHFNLLGKKKISIWDPLDRVVLPESGLETLFTDWKAPRPPYSPEYEARAQVFELEAGEGVHHPFTAPHAVRYGDEVSASVTVTFNTRATKRRAAAHFVNRKIRTLGVAPTPVGQSPFQDELKFQALSLYRRARSVVRPAVAS
jgi:hypothetical protein